MEDNKPTPTTDTKPDWLVANLQGSLPKTMGDMHQEGIATSMFNIEAPEKYWALDKIRGAFKDPTTGQERKDLFDDFYKKQVDRYHSYRVGEHALLNYNDSPNVTAKRVGAKTPTPVIYKATPDVYGRTYSSIAGYSKPERSIREAAIKTGVKTADGYVNPNDFNGPVRFSRKDNGEFNYNDDGYPYLEPFDTTKDLRSFDEVYNRSSKALGLYGMDYGWGQVASSLIKNPLNFLVSAVDSLAEYPKSLFGSTGLLGGEEGAAYKGLVSGENWLKGFKLSSTDYGQSGFFNAENINDLGQQVALQLLSMGAVGKSVGSIARSPQAGSAAARLYMVGLSAGPMADVARENGLSQRETATLLGMTTAAFYPLMSLSEAAIGALGTKESQAFMKNAINQYTKGGVVIKSGSNVELGTALLNLRSTIANFAFNLEKNLPKNGLGQMIKGATNESLEETAEQVVDLGIRNLYNVYNANVDPDSGFSRFMGTKENTQFQIDPIRELELLGQSAIGGAIGGAVASKIFNKWNSNQNEIARGIHDMVIDGKESILYDYLSRMHEQGRMDHNWATKDGKMASPGQETANDESYNVMKGVVDYLVELRDNAGLKDLYPNNVAKAAAYSKLLETSSVGKDAADLHSNILQLQDKLEKQKASPTIAPELVKQTEEELQNSIETLDKIKRGEFVTDYVTEGIYNLAALSGTRPNINMDVLSGKGFNTLNASLKEAQAKEKTEIDLFNQTLATQDSTATLDNYQGVSETGKQGLIQEGIMNLGIATAAFAGNIPAVNEMAETMDFKWNPDNLNSADPTLRAEEIDFLRNTIAPAIQDENLKKAIEALTTEADRLSKVETYQPLDAKTAPEAIDLFSRMTMDVNKTVVSMSTPIADKIKEELDLREQLNKSGAAIYTNTPKLTGILKSINQRLAQVEGLIAIGTSVDDFLVTRGKDVLTEFTKEELATVKLHLTLQKGIVNELIAESEENAKNAEVRIREITAAKFRELIQTLGIVTDVFSTTEFPLHEIINNYRESIATAIDQQDFVSASRQQMLMEDALFEKFSEKKGDILKQFPKASSGTNTDNTEAYGYLRGILSLKSSDFWNAYSSAMNLSAEKPSSSWEQDLAIKRAVQSLSADNFSPSTIALHPNMVKHHSSVFAQGKGGTGKSSYLIPLIASIYNQIYGGKVLITAFKDSRDNKRSKLLSDVKAYMPQLPAVSYSRTLLEILKDDNALKDVSLIVFDEVTLLRSKEMQEVQNELNSINKRRHDAGLATLKILYTGDTLQNNMDVDLKFPEVRPLGVDHPERHVIDRIPALRFSFRQGNQQLILFTNYLEKIQGEAGRSEGFQTEYKGHDGVRIEDKDFVKAASSLLNSLKTKNELHKAVYITDKSQFDIDPKIISTGVSIMPSVEAQGEEWDYVIYDPRNKEIFAQHKNLPVKKDFYTAATRARKFLLVSAPENSGLTSREGIVNEITPLNVEKFNKASKLQDIDTILGPLATKVEKKKSRSDVRVVPDNAIEIGGALNQPPKQATGNENTRRPESPETVNQPAPTPPPTIDTETGKVSTQGDVLAEHIAKAKGDFVALHTFYTDVTGTNLPEALTKKRQALYNANVRKTSPFFLTIAKIGTPEYLNVIRNNPEYNGSYALFLEAEIQGSRTLIGAFQTTDFDQFITDSNLLADKAKISIPISSNIIAEAQANKPWVKGGDEKKLGLIQTDSTGIHFGSIRIHRFNSADLNKHGFPKLRANEPFIPVSFRYDPREIDKVMNNKGWDENITTVPLRSVALPFKEVSAMLEKYVKKGEKDRWMYDFSEEGGRMYNAFWGNLAKDRKNQDGKVVPGPLAKALKDIYASIPQNDSAYKNFIARYSTTADPELAKTAEEIAMITNTGPIGKNTSTRNNANYFMSNYLVAMARGSQEIQLFERAIQDLSAHPNFSRGFDFDPQIAYNTTKSTVPEHVMAQQLPKDIYTNMLKGTVQYVSQPSLQIPKSTITSALKGAVVAPDVPVSSQSGAGQSVNESPSSPNTDVKRSDDFDTLENMSLLGFYRRWFLKPGYITFMPETIARFRRTFFDNIFNLNKDTPPRLRDINEVMEELRKQYAEYKAKYPSSVLDTLDPISNESHKAAYMNGVIFNEMNFLVKKYFPAVSKVTVIAEDGTKKKVYGYKSSHKKQVHFNEKETFNLLADGMTEMVKTQLYNTPVIQRTKNGYRSTGDFLNPGHIEVLVKAVKGATTREEIAEKLLASGDNASLSIFNRFYNPETYILDGKEVHAIGAISHPEVTKMVDSISIFMLSGQPFNFGSLNYDDMKMELPNEAFGVPNTLKEVLHQSVNAVAEQGKDYIFHTSDGAYVINGAKMQRSSEQEPSEEDIIKSANAIGLTNFTPGVLHAMYLYDGLKLGVNPGTDEGNTAIQVRRQIMDNVLMPTVAEMMRDGRVRFTSRIGILYDAITREAGIKSVLSHVNIDGERVYRLRYTAPIFRLPETIQEIRDTANSALSDNLLVKGDYEIVSSYVWEGVKRWDRPKSHSKMTAEETMELDLLWGFAYSLNEDHRKGTKYDTASFPGMVYSDSSTDLRFVVKAREGIFRPKGAIVNDLYKAQSLYVQKISSQITQWWNNILPVLGINQQFQNITELGAFLQTNKIPHDKVSRFPGGVRNLYFTNKAGAATIKPSLLRDATLFSSPGGKTEFSKRLADNFERLVTKAGQVKDSDGKNLLQKANRLVGNKTDRELLESFYYNWVAFSTQLSLLTNGSEYQFDDKGKDSETLEYIDFVKRAKSMTSNRSHQLFRDKSWLAKWNQAKQSGMPPEQLNSLRTEGKKLNRFGRVSYVKDPAKLLINSAGETKLQEIYDGATFASPLTRLMQYHSNAGEHGINTSSVMKNITSVFNPKTGVNTFVKNAEFLLTPEILKNGSTSAVNMVKRMLMGPFTKPVNGTNNAWELLQSLGASPDLSNVEWSHFDQLLDTLVDNSEQDSVIMEIIPATSAKTGMGAINDFDPVDETGNPLPYSYETIDLVSKGTQLDASHEIDEIPNIKTPTQHINSLSINWKDPVASLRVLSGLAKISELVSKEFDKSDLELNEKMKEFVRKAVGTKENISYLSEITDPSNKNQYSLDDRQVVNTFIRNLNAYLSDNAIMPGFEGGHFVVHPANDLVPVYETADGRVGLRKAFPAGENTFQRNLRGAFPKRKADGKRLDVIFEELYEEVTNLPFEDAVLATKSNPQLEAAVRQQVLQIQATLNSDAWEPGFAEILLPAEMFRDFYIEDLNMPVEMVTPEFFAQQLVLKKKDMAPELIVQKSVAMFEAFQQRLLDVMARIPGTGKHSAMMTKVVGFMNESQNSVFVPAELLFIQGADQDIDKGAAMTFETVEGMIPRVDENYQLINGELFSDKKKQIALVAGIKNEIVSNFMKIISDPANAVEANISVDSAMEEWKVLASQVASKKSYSRWDYLSYAEMREVNQSGKNMVGIFANALKAYQILYVSEKMGGQGSKLAGVSEDFNTVWIKLAALVNLATDNAKLQVLGQLGIGEHNGNMVAYLVMKGASPTQIAEFIANNKAEMDTLKFSRRYDAENYFNASEEWETKPELASTYYKGDEIGNFARSIMNRGVPSGPDEMYSYIYNMNRAINKTYKALGNAADFDIIRFIENEAYRNSQVAKYESLSAKKSAQGIEYSEFNILKALSQVPHISAYLKTFALSNQIVNKMSKVYRATNNVVANLDMKVNPDRYRDVQDFVYGLFTQEFFQKQNKPINGFDLGTTQGRADFTRGFASKENIDFFKQKYPGNTFAESLFLDDAKRRKYDPVKRLRTHDLMNMLEEKLLQLRVDFESIKPEDREKFVAYHLISDKSRIGKGSFGQLLQPADLKDFTSFLDTIDSTAYDYSRLGQLYKKYLNPGEDNTIQHNSIPYSDKQFGSAVSMSSGIEIPDGVVDIVNKYSQAANNIRKGATFEENLGLLESIARDARVTQAESTAIQRAITNYQKYKLDRTESETKQRIIDCN